MILAIVLISVVRAGLCQANARRRGLKAGPWVVIGACLGPLALPLVLLVRAGSSPD